MGKVVELRVVGSDVVPAAVLGRVAQPPRRKKNTEARSREWLTPDEMATLITAARKVGRYGHRDATMLMVAYLHGLRVSELVNLRWAQVIFTSGHLHVRRLKNGSPSIQPLDGDEIRALRRLQREQQPASAFLFTSERGGPITASAVRQIVARAGREAQLPITVHVHMLRHSCGYALANKGRDTRLIQDYLGHKNIANTAIYTKLSAKRFEGIWGD